jgi:hypothetical protein
MQNIHSHIEMGLFLKAVAEQATRLKWINFTAKMEANEPQNHLRIKGNENVYIQRNPIA